jgi:ATP-dependent Clp protease protease subunit
MTTGQRPEVPYPFAPVVPEPRRHGPALPPLVDAPDSDAERRLFDHRKVMLSGPLDADAVNRLCAQLMTLDGESSREVELFINSGGGGLAEALTVLDVIGLMRAQVSPICMGAARGTAAALLACGTGWRRSTPHANISLRCSHLETIEGPATTVEHEAERLAVARSRLRDLLVAATGQPIATIDEHLDRGTSLDPARAKRLGIIDAITHPSPSIGPAG